MIFLYNIKSFTPDTSTRGIINEKGDATRTLGLSDMLLPHSAPREAAEEVGADSERCGKGAKPGSDDPQLKRLILQRRSFDLFA